MRVGQRLLLAVLPAILGVLVVAALAYWGEYGRQAPRVVVAIAIIASVASLVVAWRSTRYVAQRLERLAGRDRTARRRASHPESAGPQGNGATADELDALERVVQRLSSALAVAEADRVRLGRALEAHAREYAELLGDATESAVRALDEIRLPIHILLENRFGDLNENQEEMLENARAAAEQADTELRRLREIAAFDRGAERLRRDRVRLGDIVASIRPVVDGEGAKAGVRIEVDIPPALPLLLGDRARLQEALALVLTECVRRVPRDGAVRVTAEHGAGALHLRVEGAAAPVRGAATLLAHRIVAAHGGEIAWRDGALDVTLPLASSGAVTRAPAGVPAQDR